MIMCSKSYSGLSPFRCHSSFVLVKFMLYLTLFHSINGFNLDTDSRIELDGTNAGSYFGYTVAMLNQNDQNRWILLGAPKDNSHFLPDADRPGAIYKCTFTLDFSNHSCEELFIDNKTEGDSAQFNGKNRIFTHGRDGQWLGASLDVNKDAGIVTCANRWYNKQFEVAQIYYMNGLCYEIPLDFNRNNIKKIPGLVGLDKQTMTDPRTNITKLNYGMGALGSSVHYSSKREHILLGAPGLWYFTGGLIDMHRSDALITENSKPPTERNEMAGYAITSGQYFGMGLTTFAIGAPRDHLTGKVSG
ncbi:integrin alpha-9-like [Ruditapes philippinarum]|uniref:integrin alpha-9-like n=1 Tax=Ruditapes philippinarum TaxID=129788 RepID=UPI00295A7B0A|nr:integrin alpha-9-like [Ruditapes philippinarum]